LYRAETLKQDLKYFNYTQKCYCSTVSSICNRIQILSETAPERLVAYSYVRYLGDLSGGVSLARKVVKVYNLVFDSEGSKFYQFPGIEDNEYFKKLYKTRLDDIPPEFHKSILEETEMAFKFHGPLFDDMLLDCASKCTLLNPSVAATVKSIGLSQTQAHLAIGIITSLVAISLMKA
jgi:heme oxygenase